jgi:hypothetical protein
MGKKKTDPSGATPDTDEINQQQPATGATPDTGEVNQQQPATGATPDTGAPLDWDTWHSEQDDSVKGVIAARFAKLENALKAERESAAHFQKELKSASAKLDEGSAAREQIEALTTQLEELQSRTNFIEAAGGAGVVDPTLAWLAFSSSSEKFTDKNGAPDFEALKDVYPTLFNTRPAPPPGNAGTGAQAPPARTQDMDALIRNALRKR